MQQGTINVQTENIFPIIKKFLYSDHEIFLRELVSNAVDATQKLKTLTSLGEFKGELGELRVDVVLNVAEKTLTISDKGIGMSAEEVDKYINQIAFSGAQEFVNQYKDKADATNALIGHFGLGFYSSFMVAAKVEIITKSHKDSPAVKWECDGSPNYTITEVEKTERGTDIVLHLADDSTEFLEDARIKNLLEKYCHFLPIPIFFGETQINNTTPAWTKKPADLTDEDYATFYKELYPFSDDPLFHIHLNVDYPFNLTGILYFPKLKKNFEMQKNKIQLYSNQVFVTDSVEGIVPDFLTLLNGIIDSPDIPLNVSRSYLQSDANVKKISAHITKKVADKLEELFKNNREDFEKKWDEIKIFIQYGMLSDDKFYDRANKFYLVKNIDGAYSTVDAYLEKIKPIQTDKTDQTIVLYSSNVVDQHTYVNAAKEKGYDVLVLDTVLDSHLIQKLEQKFDKTRFSRVDSDTVDKLINKEDAQPLKLSEEEIEKIKPLFEEQLDKTSYHVQFESLSEKDSPILITRPEFMRRMKDMAATGGDNWMGNMPDSYQVVVNANHPLMSKLLGGEDADAQKDLAKQAIDLALLSQGLLKGESLTQFIKRSEGLLV